VWNWSGAEREFLHAINCLAPLGRRDAAIDQLRRAIRLDPLSAFLRPMLGQIYGAGEPTPRSHHRVARRTGAR
jgi:hypothetical protein